MGDKTERVLKDVAEYYSEKLAQHGETPQGVDWNGEEGQYRRFEQLIKIVSAPSGFSVNDLGCGYGALFDYLEGKYSSFTYHGFDVSQEMVLAAKRRYSDKESAHFSVASRPDKTADYSVASGIFNVRLMFSDAEWKGYIESTLDELARSSRLGFSFNCLTSYSDEDKKRPDLYYADACQLFDFCKRHYSRHVSLLHDYGLYEFTILVRKVL